MRCVMVALVVAAGLAGVAVAQDGPPPGPPRGDWQRGPEGPAGLGRGRVFISPMGEPFRARPDAPAPQDQWFDGADANRDGVLSEAEMVADAARFFAMLDVRQDGEIDPDDIERYENVVAPEIRVGGLRGDRRAGGGRRGQGRGRAPGSGDAEPDGPLEGRQGAARFGYFDYPEPVTNADRNFNRGVDRQEFRKATEARFAVLDKNGDGKLEKGELPKLSANAPRGGGRGGREAIPPAE